jgi:hypothetical protein
VTVLVLKISRHIKKKVILRKEKVFVAINILFNQRTLSNWKIFSRLEN